MSDCYFYWGMRESLQGKELSFAPLQGHSFVFETSPAAVERSVSPSRLAHRVAANGQLYGELDRAGTKDASSKAYARAGLYLASEGVARSN